MRTRIAAVAMSAVAVTLLLGACGEESPESGSDPEVTQESTDPTPPVEPTSEPTNGVDEALILEASTLLAEQEDVEAADIAVVRSFPVEWRTSALGCAKDGMAYLDVITPGYFIELEVDGEKFGFHGQEGQPPFHCAKPSEPITPAT